MAIHCRTFSLVCILLISTRGAAIVIVNGDREGHRCGQLRRRQWRAWSRIVRWLLCRKIPPPIKPFTLRVPQHPLRPSACGVLKQINHAPFPLERKRRHGCFGRTQDRTSLRRGTSLLGYVMSTFSHLFFSCSSR